MAQPPGTKLGFRQRIAQLRVAFVQTKAVDPRLVPAVALAAGGVLVLFVVLGVLLGGLVFWILLGVLLALLAALLVFGWRTSKAAIRQIEGRPGAAAAVVQSMRGPWRLTPAVAVTRNQDFVHRVIGRPGIVLVGEGAPARVAQLLKQEARRVSRAVGDTPVHEVSVGDGPGQIPLGQLQAHLTRLPRALKPGQVGPLDTRLKAIADTNVPVPKGPMPRVPKGRRRG